MTTYTVTIDEKTREGKQLITKLKATSGVVLVKRGKGTAVSRKSAVKRKSVLSNIESKEDVALGNLIKREETGKTVSKSSILKTLRSIK